MSAQSRSIGTGEPPKVNLAKVDESVMKKIESIAQAAAVDEDFVIVSGKCQTLKLPYLLKYERAQKHAVETSDFRVDPTLYNLVGVPAEKDFDELSDLRANAQTVNTEVLIGAPGYPHCGATLCVRRMRLRADLLRQGRGKPCVLDAIRSCIWAGPKATSMLRSRG